MNPEELIEKYAILSILIDNATRVSLSNNANPFNITVFKECFNSYSLEELNSTF